jgi:hypothetical protein
LSNHPGQGKHGMLPRLAITAKVTASVDGKIQLQCTEGVVSNLAFTASSKATASTATIACNNTSSTRRKKQCSISLLRLSTHRCLGRRTFIPPGWVRAKDGSSVAVKQSQAARVNDFSVLACDGVPLFHHSPF